MKRNLLISFAAMVLISACSSSNRSLPSETETKATATLPPPTATTTQIPPTTTPTLTPSSAPTIALPVSQLTPVPSTNTKINNGNVNGLKEIARYYGDISYAAKLTKDKKFLFILDPDGITKYNYETMEPITTVALANSASDLQINNDGTWMIIENKWLVDLRNEKEPQINVLPDLLDLYAEIYALSPDGSMIAAQRYNCGNLCEHELRIVSTKDFSVLHADKAPTLQNVFAFSPDGAYYAVVDTVKQENPDGSTSSAGAVGSIWKTSDFTKVASIPIRFPFRVSSIAFSPDNSMLAVSQPEFIDIFDFQGGDPKITIGNLCFTDDRNVMFGLLAPLILIEKSNCSSMVWKISGNIAAAIDGNGPDLSKVMFDEAGNYKIIPFTYPIVSDFKSYREMYYFSFLNDNMISFKSFDHGSLARRSCNLSLADSSFDCQTYESQEENGRILEKSRILAGDGKYYDYSVSPQTVDIYSPDNPSQIYYSIPFRNYGFELEGLDPENKVIFYNMYLSTNTNRAVILDMSNDHILQKWEGETSIPPVVFSGNEKYAAFCRGIGYNTRPNKDKLVIFDLTAKKIIYNENFTCSGVSLALTHDGSKIGIEYSYLKKPTDRRYSARILIFNTLTPYDKKYIDVESTYRAAVFSPDGSLLAVACGESDICFFDTATNNKIYQLKAHSHITNLAFSPDGNFLAGSSNWGLISVWAVPSS